MLRALAIAITATLSQTAAPPAPPATPAAPAPRPALPGATPAPPVPEAHDRVSVVLPKEHASLLGSGARAGRIIVFFVGAAAPKMGSEQPSDAPFYDSPQPIYSVPVSALVPGSAIDVGFEAASYPAPMDELVGEFRVQAVFDRNTLERSHLAPGNLISDVQTVVFSRDRAENFTLDLTQSIPAESPPAAPNLKFISVKSALLSQAAGHDVFHRVGVALPQGWDDPSFRRRLWPAIYVVPGFGGRDSAAARYARMLSTTGAQGVVPQAVWVVLDPESEWGHHGFVDSPANGPRGKALVEELIPELERQLRLIPRPDARVITGHSSGGWTSLWLQLAYPTVFGACFSSAPDPVDFSAFQMVDLYGDTSYYSDPEGKERPSYRVPVVKQFEKVRMTNRDEAGMEYALSPEGRSGEQLDTYNSMWSTLDPRTRLPRRMFDPTTGIIDHQLVEREWSRYDITRLVKSDPARYLPTLRQKVRLLVGEKDNFYLERAVERLKAAAESAAQAAAAKGTPFPEGPGYIQVLPEQTHFTLPGTSMLRWHGEMREYLKANNLD